MGKKSVKENKNAYQLARESCNYTRDQASELMDTVSSDRIEKIENERSFPHPEEILEMSKCYKEPTLCNYYCTHECPIGMKHISEIKIKELSQITLEMLASLNSLEKQKTRFIEITVDGEISDDEIEDFNAIKEKLEQISQAVDSLKMWVEKEEVSKF